MSYSVKDLVVVRVNGVYRVGAITQITRLKRGIIYSVLMENGKLVENCSVNKELTTNHIIKGLTKTLNNADGQKEISSTEEEGVE